MAAGIQMKKDLSGIGICSYPAFFVQKEKMYKLMGEKSIDPMQVERYNFINK